MELCRTLLTPVVAQRPCSRCLSNGKEEACVDVQHKKRGRPRLRDEREPRYDNLSSAYQQPTSDAPMRRPHSMYIQGSSSMSPVFGDQLQRSGSYRVLKSHGHGPTGGPIAPRYLEHASLSDANVYSSPMQLAPRVLSSQDPLCAYLNMEMQIAKVSQAFADTIGLSPLVSRNFQEIVSANDVEKITRLQRAFEEERREREPNYLPPIYLKLEEDRVIQGVGFGSGELDHVRPNRQEVLTFQALDGHQRTFQVRMGLAKKDSTYFIAVLLSMPSHQSFQPMPPSPFGREGYVRESQYGYQPPQPGYMQSPNSSMFGAAPNFDPRIATYRPPGSLGGNISSAAASIPVYTPTSQRQDYMQTQIPYQTPRSELPPAQPSQQLVQQHSQRQHDLQLPPIRDQRSEVSSTVQLRRGNDRAGRVDIGGLIENPEARRSN